MGLRLTPSTRRFWRGHDELQLELGGRSIVVAGSAAHTVGAMDPSGLEPPPVEGPAESAVGPTLSRILDALTRLGFLTATARPDRPAGAGPPRDLTAATARIAPDVAALSARFGARAHETVRARQGRRVTVQGGGRLPTLVASLFAAAGVGHVSVAQGGEVGLGDALPGGLRPGDEGHRADRAGSDAIRRAAPGVDTSLSWWPMSDLTILAVDAPVRTAIYGALAAAAQVHLVVTVWGASATIGPLVVPGETSCLGCADLHRNDRDPAWPALAAQLTTEPPHQTPSEVAVCVLAAAVTVAQGLAFLDGEHPATIDGTLEMTLPDWRLRRRSWLAHPDCPCAPESAARHTGLRE